MPQAAHRRIASEDGPFVLALISNAAPPSPPKNNEAIRQFYQAQEIVMPSTVVSALSVGVNVGFNYLL